MRFLQEMIGRLEDKVADQEKRLNTLEKQVFLSGESISSGGGGGYAASKDAAAANAELRKLEQEDATSRIVAKLEERGVDARCMDYWKTHPQCHIDLLDDMENEELPPGRDPSRDESPYWMTKLKKHMENVAFARGGYQSSFYSSLSKGKGKGKRSRSRSRDRYSYR